jgi:hypothetical protein
MSDISQDPVPAANTKRPTIDTPAVSTSPEGRSAEFIAVTGPQADTTSATTMLVTAYSLLWLILFGFGWMTWRRQQRLNERLQVAESRVAKLNAGDQK